MDDKHKAFSLPKSPTPEVAASPPEAYDDSQASDTNRDGTGNHPLSSLEDEIQALKSKLSQLERHVKIESGSVAEDNLSQPRNETSHSSNEPKRHLMAQMEEYRRMEQCLYDHRKEWETENGPADWRFETTGVYAKTEGYLRPRWRMRTLREDDEYKRPDPFDPSNWRNEEARTGATAGYGIFDHAIDYGDRRERLRQNFEWDLERIFLAEEIDKRRRKDEADAAAKRTRAEAIAKAIGKGYEATKTGSLTKRKIDLKIPEPESQLRRLDWLSFQESPRAAHHGVCIIDVLIGEPVIANNRDPWYSLYSRGSEKKPDNEPKPITTVAEPGKGPLPERIRVYSPLLQAILTKVLGQKVEEGEHSEFVLLRPFKSLTHCEMDLRDWHSALEKKLRKRRQSKIVHTDCVPQVSDAADLRSPEDLLSQVDPSSQSDLLHSTARVQEFKEGGTGIGHVEEEQELEEDELDTEGDEPGEEDDDETRTEAAKEHLQTLLHFIDTELSARRDHLQGQNCNRVHFSDLWHLFRPGMEVIENNGRQVYRVIKVSSARHRVVPAWEMYWKNDNDQKKQSPPFNISCVYVDFNGKALGPVKVDFAFPRFNGEREITSLPVYPFQFHPHRRSDFSDSEWNLVSSLPQNQRLKAKLIRRGETFLEVAGVKQMYYAGPTIDARDEVESQVVVDFETALSIEEQQKWKPELQMLMGAQDDEKFPERFCNAQCCLDQNIYDDQYIDERQKSEYIDRILSESGGVDASPSVAIIPRSLNEIQPRPTADTRASIPDEDLLIMSYRVFGFVLRNRKWAQLDLTYMTDLYTSDHEEETLTREVGGINSKRKTAFDRLVLEDGHKDMILSLTAQHFRDKESAASGPMEQVDIVKGKGKGLIILLHGAPGVGKTSTAEGVAEVFKRPLFQITCGDLGTTAKEVELALETNFTLANKWGCILLLDEADVFLAERNKEDFVRNGLVAVFLRVMEYYSGVLFLTTNRIGDFDEAFASRIHVSLYYPELDKKKTRDIFQINLEMIKERFRKKKRNITMERDEIIDFARDHSEQTNWNGRQIRNACQTALALAEYDAQGGSYDQILKPDRMDALVELKVDHFEKVQKAYVEFTEYIERVYGTDVSQRAKENRLRAKEKKQGKIMNMEAGRNDFAAAANARPYTGAPGSASIQNLYPAPAFSSASGFQQQAASGMQQPMFGQYTGMSNAYAPQGHPSQFPRDTASNQAMMGTNVFQANQATQNRGMQQSSPAQQAQQLAENHPNSQQQAYLHQQAQALHASGQSGGAHQMPLQVAGFAEGFPVQQQWSQGPTNV